MRPLALLAAGLLLAACTGTPATTPADTPLLPVTTPPPAAQSPGSLTPEPGATFPDDTDPPQQEVSIVDFGYEPASLEVSAGTPVMWMNGGNAPHTVTFEDETVDSGRLGNGETFEHTFDSEGTFEYLCTIHPQMRGTLTVTP